MKKLNLLWVVEADKALPPLCPEHESLLAAFSIGSIGVKTVDDLLVSAVDAPPELVLFHSDLTITAHLQRFVQVQALLPHSSLIIVSRQQDEELCLLALEAGADDSIAENQLTERYLRKTILISGRHSRIEKELNQNREQLLACLQNTPNVAIQWYNDRSEVVFWNKASEAIFGWTAEEAVGKTVDSLIPVPENREYWLQKMLQLKKNVPGVLTEEWSFTHPNGSRGHCLSTLFSISSTKSNPLFVCMDVDITERHRMEEALQESEEKYQALFNQASDAIFINTLEGEFLNVNQQACHLLGLSKEALLKMRVEDLYSTEELARRPIMRRELASGQRTHIERAMKAANGKELTVEVTAQQMQDGRIIAIVRDISERKNTELALQQSEEKYRSLIDQQADAITIFDKHGKIRDVNSSATVMLQYSKEEFQQMALADVLLKEETIANPVDFTLLTTGVSTIKQRKMIRKDGTLVETEVHTKRLYDGLFLASVRDLTERIDVQHRLQKEIELSESIINSLPGLFYLFTREGKYLRWNRQQETLTEYSADEIAGMKPLDFITNADKKAVQAAIAKTFTDGHSTIEANLLTKGGSTIPCYFTGIKVQYAGTECLLGTGTDLSALRNLEKKLSQQKIAEQKRLMQAMIDAEEKERYKLGLELHDNVNQILSVVRMYLSILNTGEKIKEITLPKAMSLLDNAITEIRHLSHSLAMSYKFETGLASTLEEMVKKIQAAKDFTVTLSLPLRLDDLTTTRQKLAVYRIVQEQLNNIIKHARATLVNITVALTEDELRLAITDNGQGFNPAKTKKGLGLNNITNRAEALSGKATLTSKPGKGAGLEVVIPLGKV